VNRDRRDSLAIDPVERLDRLEAVQAAHALLLDYADALDDADVARLASLFLVNGLCVTQEGERRGPDEIAAFYSGVLASSLVGKRHFVTNSRVSWREERSANIVANFLFMEPGASTPAAWGIYRGVVVVDGDQAKFAELHVERR
jgi:hypothetical protein